MLHYPAFTTGGPRCSNLRRGVDQQYHDSLSSSRTGHALVEYATTPEGHTTCCTVRPSRSSKQLARLLLMLTPRTNSLASAVSGSTCDVGIRRRYGYGLSHPRDVSSAVAGTSAAPDAAYFWHGRIYARHGR